MIDRAFRMIETNGVRLRAVVEGNGPLVILLHGWPQCWYLWRHQIDPLVDAGFQVAVPDQRGFGGSDRPPAIADYNIRTLVLTSRESRLRFGTRRSASSATTGGASSPGILPCCTQPPAERSWGSRCLSGASLQRS